MRSIVLLLFISLLGGCVSNSIYKKSSGSFSTAELRQAKPVVIPEVKYINATDGIKLAYREYVPEELSAVMIFYHGATSHSGANYPHIGVGLRDDYNVLTITPDRRGHGVSEGPRGDAPTTEQMYEDINTFIKLANHQYPNIPVFLGGHSAGAGMLINYNSYIKNEPVAGYAFVAPKLGFRSETGRSLKSPFVTDVKRDLFIEHARTGGSGNEKAIFFNVSDETLKRFPNFVTAITVNMANATTPMSSGYQLSRLESPAAVWIGSEDEVFDPEKLIGFVNENNPEIETHLIDGDKHLSIVLNSARYIGLWIHQQVLGNL